MKNTKKKLKGQSRVVKRRINLKSWLKRLSLSAKHGP
jgi:hypothetical protein